MSDIRTWLEQHRLGKYSDLFADNEIEVEDLVYLSDTDLENLGLPLGPRRRLLGALAQAPEPHAPPEATEPAGLSVPRERAEPEHRQLTVMFCDLVDSVGLGERMDIESYRALLGRFRDAVTDAVKKHGGFVARHQGDGLLVYFGYPQAAEDDAERAVRAGLSANREVSQLDSSDGQRPRLRVGIATGPVIVGDALSTDAERPELAAFGSTPNLSARLQGEAAPNTVVVSATTRELAGDFFDFDALAPRRLKGLSEPVVAFSVRGERVDQSRFEARSARYLSPLVGREEESGMLELRRQRALAGDGQAALLVAEAGVGKSRLLQHVRERFRDAGNRVLLQCEPHQEARPLHPVVAALRRAVAAGSSDGAVDIIGIRAHLSTVAIADEDAARLLAALLSVPIGSDSGGRTPDIAPQQREPLLRLLVDYVERLSQAAPVLIAFEDVHWADASTLELLARLVDAAVAWPALILVTSRPGFDASWLDLPHVTVLSLSRLDKNAGESLARAVAGDAADELKDAIDDILARAGGNALYIEELTRSVLQSTQGTGAPERTIPTTLRDSLMARLDVLGSAKSLAQCAAVIGREFGQALLRQVWDGDTASLASGLDALVSAGLVFAQGGERYAFKHALVRDVAYESMLKSRRIGYHRAVADQLLHEAGASDADLALVAEHFAASEAHEQALECFERAARASADQGAYPEAKRLLQAALIQLSALPPARPRDVKAVELNIRLGRVAREADGQAGALVAAAFERAVEIGSVLGPDANLLEAYRGLTRFYAVMKDDAQAQRYCQLLIETSKRDGSPSAIAVAYQASSFCAALFERWPDAYRDGVEATRYGLEVTSREVQLSADLLPHSFGSHAAVIVGYPDVGLREANAAIRLAEELDSPYAWTRAGNHLCYVCLLLQDFERMVAEADRISAAMERFHMGDWYARQFTSFRGLGLCGLGRTEEGLELWRQLQGGAWDYFVSMTYFAPYMAMRGDTFGAHELLDAGDAYCLQWRDAPTARDLNLRASVHIQSGELDAAESCLRRALDVAREDGTRWWELEAAIMLARHLHARSRAADAHAILNPVYARFDEGHATPMLKHAREILGKSQADADSHHPDNKPT